jgi:hypothetical protein
MRQRGRVQVRHAGCPIPGEASAEITVDGRDALGGSQVYSVG